MKTAIIGGTFNPPHIGHLQLAYELYSLGKFEKIIFVPAGTPAHKREFSILNGKKRITMLEKCIHEKYFEIDPCELNRRGVTYTIDTLIHFQKKYGEKPAFVIGDDLLSTFSKWRDSEAVAAGCSLLVAHRLYIEKQDFNYKHQYINNPILDISSSDIRERIRSGRPISCLVSYKVEKYIRRNHLYVS